MSGEHGVNSLLRTTEWLQAPEISEKRGTLVDGVPNSNWEDRKLDAGTETIETQPQVINLTETAAKKVRQLLDQEGNPEFFLRVAVQPGGCSGLRYSLYFDDRAMDGDIETLTDGVPVRVDRMSAPYLRGCRVDWLETLQQSGFTIDNPNVHGTCACGDSFH